MISASPNPISNSCQNISSETQLWKFQLGYNVNIKLQLFFSYHGSPKVFTSGPLMPILLRILLNVGRLTIALFLLLTNCARLREELTLEQFERDESFRSEREAASRPLSREAFEGAFETEDEEGRPSGEPLSVDAFWAMLFQRPHGGLGWRLTPVRECLAQMAEPGLAYIQQPCYRRLQELQSTHSFSSKPSQNLQRPLELLLFYRCFLNSSISAGYDLHNATVTAVRREENYVITFSPEASTSNDSCSPFWLHDYDGFSQLDSPPMVIEKDEASVEALQIHLEDEEEIKEVAILLADDAMDPGNLTPLLEDITDNRRCLLTALQPGSGLISTRCADLVKEKLPHLLGLYAAYRCYLPQNPSSSHDYIVHAAKVRNMIPEAGGGLEDEDKKKVIIYFELERENSKLTTCLPSWERQIFLQKQMTAQREDEEDGVSVTDEL